MNNKSIVVNVSFLRKLKKVWQRSCSPEKEQIIASIDESIKELQKEYEFDLQLEDEYL